MVRICSHTIAKNSADFIEPVLRQILPYTERSIVSIDLDSEDNTRSILLMLQNEFPHLEILDYKVRNPFTDLVEERNFQLSVTKEPLIWIVDDDEYYFDDEIKDILSKIKKSKANSYSVKFWFLTDKTHYNPARGKRTIRFYRNFDGIKWVEKFGNEYIKIRNAKHLNNSYIHLSYLKSYSWRNDFYTKKKYTKQTPIAELPKNICRKLEHFWEGNYPKQQKQSGRGN